MRNAVVKPLVLLAACAAVWSCADVPPVIPVSVEVPLQSKPVKMPPTNRKLGSAENISLEDFYALQQTGKVLIYDVRLPYFHAIDHIPGSVNWSYKDYDGQVQARDIEIQKVIKEGKQVVLYCFNQGCPEARNVAKKLARRDYDVRVLGAGIDAWREAGLPLDAVKASE